MKIYVVTSGCYSDFHINAMFSTGEKAQKYIDAAKFDGIGHAGKGAHGLQAVHALAPGLEGCAGHGGREGAAP